MVMNVSEHDWVRMNRVLLDCDRDEALNIIKDFVKRLKIQAGKGLKSHLDSA
jgi:hypothetical protein